MNLQIRARTIATRTTPATLLHKTRTDYSVTLFCGVVLVCIHFRLQKGCLRTIGLVDATELDMGRLSLRRDYHQ